MNIWIPLVLIVLASLVLTELIRRYTLNKNLIDIPNERSSHTIPTPRGGGLSIVVVFLISISFITPLSADIYYALLGAGILIAGIGFWDDHNHIPAKWRLISHFTAVFWVLYWLGGVEEFHILDYNINPGFLGLVFVALLLVWLLNLFNFMDGIDGIAATEAIFVSSVGAYFSWISGLEWIAISALILAAASLGFLLLNWPPAKIFMGDVGSSFLGLMLGVIAYASIIKGVSVWIWIIILGVFLVDSGVTLLRRILNGERWYEAHCSHAYQHAAKKWGHKKVTINVLLINLFWLFPLAFISFRIPGYGLWFTLLAVTPLITVALKLNAGITVK